MRAIELVHAGDAMLSPQVTRRLIALVAGDGEEAARARRARERLETLTAREREVALAVGAGRANADIAAELHMSVATVKAHVSRLLAKLERGEPDPGRAARAGSDRRARLGRDRLALLGRAPARSSSWRRLRAATAPATPTPATTGAAFTTAGASLTALRVFFDVTKPLTACAAFADRLELQKGADRPRPCGASWSCDCGCAWGIPTRSRLGDARRLPPWDAVRRRSSRNVRARVAVLAGVVVLIAVAASLVLRGDAPDPGAQTVPTPPAGQSDAAGSAIPDPFAYTPDREDDFVARASQGAAHVLYARSPGGALATAERVARWRPQVERAAKQAKVDPDMLEALVFLESAGREDAIASDTEGAVGLTQILAETGQNLLGMQVDVRPAGG